MDELWFQQKLLDDRISIRLGPDSCRHRVVISETSALFLNTTLGFPASVVYESSLTAAQFILWAHWASGSLSRREMLYLPDSDL